MRARAPEGVATGAEGKSLWAEGMARPHRECRCGVFQHRNRMVRVERSGMRGGQDQEFGMGVI